MRILVTFAVEAEFAPWRKLYDFRKTTTGGVDRFLTRFSGAELNVFLTGIAGKSGWLEAATALYDSEIDVCISSGLAGGLRPDHKIGEILVAEKVLAAERDLSAFSEPSLVESAIAMGAKRALFYTANHVVIAAAEKRKLGAFADAVEMESCGVLVEAGLFAAKTVAIRAISDTSEEDLPLDFNRVTNDSGDVSLTRVLGEVVSAPGSIPALMRFGQRSRFAAQSLANFLERYLQALVVERRSAPVVPVQ